MSLEQLFLPKRQEVFRERQKHVNTTQSQLGGTPIGQTQDNMSHKTNDDSDKLKLID